MLRLFIAMLMLFVSTSVVAADGCRPLPQVDKRELGSGPYAQGLLFEIATKGSPPSYIFGTVHLADPEITRVHSSVLAALRRSRRFVMEAMFDHSSIEAFSRRMIADHAGDIERELAPDVFSKLTALLHDYRVQPALAARLKPWAAFMTLAVPPAHDALPLDLVLAQAASQQGLGVEGLETLSEQAEVLEQLPYADQVALLRDTVCHYQQMRSELLELKVLYRRRELDRLLSSSRKYAAGPDGVHYRHLLQGLLLSRNVRMADRLRPKLRRGGNFIAVGALHLAGDQGLLALIARDGYTVTRRY